MIKPLEKIGEFFVGGRYVTEVCDKIVKNKKLSKTERLNLILIRIAIFITLGNSIQMLSS